MSGARPRLSADADSAGGAVFDGRGAAFGMPPFYRRRLFPQQPKSAGEGAQYRSQVGCSKVLRTLMRANHRERVPGERYDETLTPLTALACGPKRYLVSGKQ